MSVDAAKILQQNWPLFVKFKATKTCTYQKLAENSYDPNSGNVTETITSSHTGIEIVFDKFKHFVVDESTIKTIDRIAIFPALNLSVAPSTNDRIVDHNGTIWRVVGLGPDPVDAHHELHVRPIG